VPHGNALFAVSPPIQSGVAADPYARFIAAANPPIRLVTSLPVRGGIKEGHPFLSRREWVPSPFAKKSLDSYPSHPYIESVRERRWKFHSA
jgi:hypothetical protein